MVRSVPVSVTNFWLSGTNETDLQYDALISIRWHIQMNSVFKHSRRYHFHPAYVTQEYGLCGEMTATAGCEAL